MDDAMAYLYGDVAEEDRTEYLKATAQWLRVCPYNPARDVAEHKERKQESQ
jgi:hypothetical protein